MNVKKKILFVVSEDWYFISHRLHLSNYAIENGFEVLILTRINKYRKMMEGNGLTVIDWSLNRKSKNLFSEIRAIKEIISVIWKYKPNVIHAVAMKPVIYTAFACKYFTKVNSCVFALGGLGFIFSSNKYLTRILRSLIVMILRSLFSGVKTRLILQNIDDKITFLKAGIINEDKIRLIRGAGVDTSFFTPSLIPTGIPLVILPGRMLWDKGVREFVECSRALKFKEHKVRFALIGKPDPCNPESISIAQLNNWVKEDVIEWWGERNDMIEVYKQSTVVCLPSYHEGLPKSLLEAASCSRPIVTYDVPGCREVVIDSVNGFLVKFQDQRALLFSIEKLLNDKKLCINFGHAGRELVLKEFTQEKIALETLHVWIEVLS